MIQIVLVANGIQIGGVYYPNNSLIFSIEKTTEIRIALVHDKRILISTDFTNFVDENSNPYATAQEVIDVLLQNNSAGGGGDVTQAELDAEITARENADTALDNRTTILENNEYKIYYFASISSASGTITKPTNSTILLDSLVEGVDAVIETIVNGKPSGFSPVTAGGTIVTVSSFDTDGDYTLSGTPSATPVALVYVLKIKGIDYQNLDLDYVLGAESYGVKWGSAPLANKMIKTDSNKNLASLSVSEDSVIKDSFDVHFDGQSGVLLAGTNAIKRASAVAGDVTGFSLKGDVSGSVEIDMKKNGVSMIGGSGNKIDLISASSDTGLPTSWTSTTFAIDDEMEWSITSATTITKVWLTVKYNKTS